MIITNQLSQHLINQILKKNDKILSNNKSNSSANIIQINISNPNNYSHKYLFVNMLAKNSRIDR